MYAVIQTGGKQYRVTEGETLRFEKLPGEAGDAVVFDSVLMVGEGDAVEVGTPHVAGAKVKGKIVEQGRHKKISIIKFKRRKHYDKQQGHRQYYTAVKITGITGAKKAKAA